VNRQIWRQTPVDEARFAGALNDRVRPRIRSGRWRVHPRLCTTSYSSSCSGLDTASNGRTA